MHDYDFLVNAELFRNVLLNFQNLEIFLVIFLMISNLILVCPDNILFMIWKFSDTTSWFMLQHI